MKTAYLQSNPEFDRELEQEIRSHAIETRKKTDLENGNQKRVEGFSNPVAIKNSEKLPGEFFL